jgi:hypothetical protein
LRFTYMNKYGVKNLLWTHIPNKFLGKKGSS